MAVALVRAQKHGTPKLDARMLLLHALGQDPHDAAWLIVNDGVEMSATQAEAFVALCARRRAGEPVAYILGHKAFYGLRLAIDARVLDPRDDTETLVDWALEHTASTVLDLGTGSGAIALALQSQRPAWQVHATDTSEGALAVARANAAALNLPVQFHHGDWLEAVVGQRFDLIVSNPPYIAATDPHLAALQHEPQSALVSGADGLDDIRRIISSAPACLKTDGWLLLEHGHDQAAAVRALLSAAGFDKPVSRTDLADIERCSGAQWPGRG